MLQTRTDGQTGVSPAAGPADADIPLKALVESDLAPLTARIDREGVYPEAFLREAGRLGAFKRHLASQNATASTDIAGAIRATEVISAECMTTGFVAWCQNACAWYVENSASDVLKREALPKLANAEALGATALSNPMKWFANIEDLKLTAERVDGGYVVSGALPWVSNLGQDHYFGAIFRTTGDNPRPLMALINCADPGFSLTACPEFTALEGSRTFGCHFDRVFVPDAHILADPLPEYIRRIRPGFVLLQMGMGLGLIDGCIQTMREANETLAHVNGYLDDQVGELEEVLGDARSACYALAETPFDDSEAFFADVLQLRLTGSEMSLRASQSALLHCGARGYKADAAAQRKLRESYFVAIVTPAIKHLRKELARIHAH
ncbi:acyl-CoA dehydrogenase family protein [Thioalkalivibrio sp. ALJT]|uniref:acyl-CoA dehydrogenase family protein n=1 Tax=Thioalkalivibrio sp. ALJT TaxID=1158146 RepID=UPI00037F049A|nr:acyl-CoA dehydrogenase family protein [Thioalkalivibrio sp. ALJT]